MDAYKIDSHKLMYHVERLSGWLRGETIYPIHVEISPSGACNHRCVFCAKDFVGYRKKYLDAAVLAERLNEMGTLGVKSAMYAGEGEPLLHRRIGEIVRHTRACGIDVAITTNGVLLGEALCEEILPATEWIKIRINAGRAETYSRIHQCRPDDFTKVIRNLERAVRLRTGNVRRCSLGMQMLLLPENWSEAPALAGIARDIGVDYLVIKAYSHHPASKTQRYKGISYQGHESLAEELANYETEAFQVVFRARTMESWDDRQREYDACLALPFWAYLDSSGDLWGCRRHLADDRFRYGTIYRQTFREIWTGEKRYASLRFVANELPDG
jgi:cyclic pyranopterin phosphate synthase